MTIYNNPIKEISWADAEKQANAKRDRGLNQKALVDALKQEGQVFTSGGKVVAPYVNSSDQTGSISTDNVSGGEQKRGPMDLAAYLKAYGSNTEETFNRAIKKAREQYDQSVRLANDEMYRALMTYGKNAEALAAGGLTGAGVSDYGNHAAYAARQGAVATAGAAQQSAVADAAAVKQEADAANARSFAEYLQNYEAQEKANAEAKNTARANVFSTILSSGITDQKVAEEMLRQTGYFTEEEIANLGGLAAGFASTQKKDLQTQVDEGNVAAATDAFNSLLSQGSTVEGAVQQIKTLYGEDVANTVKTNQTSVANTQIVTRIDNLDGTTLASGVKSQLDDAVKNGTVSQTKDASGVSEYDRLLATAQGKNEEFLSKVFTNARTEYWVEDAANALGLTLEEGLDEEDAAEAVLKAAKETVVQMYRDGDLSAEGASGLLLSSFRKDLDTARTEKGSLGAKITNEFTVLYNAREDAKKLRIDGYYTDALQSFLENVTIEEKYGTLLVNDNGRIYSVGVGKLERKANRAEKGRNIYRLPISYGNQDGVVLKGDLPEVFIDLYEYWKETQGSEGSVGVGVSAGASVAVGMQGK